MSCSITGYSKLRKIAEGGMGVIYCGIERSRNRRVAIKKLPKKDTNHQFNTKKFRNEAAILTSLYHDSIIRTYDYGESNESLYIAMEYIDGPDLEKCMSWPEFHRDIGLFAVFQALQGLHFAHQKGIVHGDIKPSNILISQSGKAKLSDFGLSLSKVYSLHLEDIKDDLTPPLYMPPELAKMVAEHTGITHDAWVETAEIVDAELSPVQEQRIRNKGIQRDIWSVGVLLYRVCSGIYPFFGKDLPGLLHAIVGIMERNILELAPDLPPYLAQVISACLEKETYKRPVSLEPVLAALRRYFSVVSTEDGEKAIRKYIKANISPGIEEKEVSHQPLVSEKMALFTFPDSEQIIVPQLEEVEPDERNGPSRGIQRLVGAGPKSFLHSRLSPGLSTGLLLIVLSGIFALFLFYRDTGTTARKDEKSLTAETIDPGRKNAYLLPDTIQTDRTGMTAPQKPTAENVVAGKQTAERPPQKNSGLPKGILKLTLNPAEAMVFINGKAVSRDGLTAGTSLKAGRYEIMIQHPGYEPYQSALQIKEGRTQLVSVILQPVTKGNGQLHVYSYPWADLYIDGTLTGTTPTQVPVSLAEGQHAILVKRDGFKPYTETVQVKKNEVTRLQITLNKSE
jgi:serine/threonine protein kinase